MSMLWLSLCLVVAAEPSESASDLFTRRIVPIVQSSRASSCTECHFGGVDLRQYVLDDAAQTFAALKSAGLVDVTKPGESKLLTFINRKPEKENPALAKVRAEEYAAFKSWIEAAARDPAMLAANVAAKSVGSPLPVEVVRHGRHDRVLQSFIENIWVEVERCENCHSSAKNQRQVKQHGEQISWMVPGDPAATLATIIDHDLINVADPDRSLILQKPLAQVEHGGHIKFPVGSRNDKQYRRFLHDYAAIVKGQYRTVADLPPPPGEFTVATGQHLRITDFDASLRGRLIRVDLFAADGGSAERRVATGDGRIGDKDQWQSLVFAVVPREADSARVALTRRLIPAGRYTAKVYVDRTERIEKNRDEEFDERDFIGTLSLDGSWKPGYLPPKILSAKTLQ